MKKHPLKPISACRTYALSWDSKGEVEVCLLETGDTVGFLEDNYGPVLRAVFSRDMRRILCQNYDGTICVWSMPPRKLKADKDSKNIVEYLDRNGFGCAYRQKLPAFLRS